MIIVIRRSIIIIHLSRPGHFASCDDVCSMHVVDDAVGSPFGSRASIQHPVRAADQPVQREDLLVLVVLDGVRGGRDVHLHAVVVPAYYC